MTKLHGWPPVIVFFGIAALGSVLHCSPLAGARLWGRALPSLYYIPILIAGITLGTRAAVGVGLISGLSHALASAFGCGEPWIGPFTDAILYVGVGITAATLIRTLGSIAVAPPGPSSGQAGESLENAYRGMQSVRDMPALSQVVAGLIHRFRTPVSSIEGAVDLLQDRRFPEEKREEFVRIIHKEFHQLERALSDILDFTQPRILRCQEVDLSQLLDQVIQRVGPKEHGPYFLFRKAIAPNLPVLNCDPEQVGKMLLNLLMNSIQATPGGGQIAIAAHTEADCVIITANDHGRGMPPGIIGRVFDPFFATRDNALGLGLTVARQIVAAHCGTIAIIDCSGKGTTISARLPLILPYPHEYRPHTGG
jgi:signal transduction histidine kinase